MYRKRKKQALHRRRQRKDADQHQKTGSDQHELKGTDNTTKRQKYNRSVGLVPQAGRQLPGAGLYFPG